MVFTSMMGHAESAEDRSAIELLWIIVKHSGGEKTINMRRVAAIITQHTRFQHLSQRTVIRVLEATEQCIKRQDGKTKARSALSEFTTITEKAAVLATTIAVAQQIKRIIGNSILTTADCLTLLQRIIYLDENLTRHVVQQLNSAA